MPPPNPPLTHKPLPQLFRGQKPNSEEQETYYECFVNGDWELSRQGSFLVEEVDEVER